MKYYTIYDTIISTLLMWRHFASTTPKQSTCEDKALDPCYKLSSILIDSVFYTFFSLDLLITVLGIILASFALCKNNRRLELYKIALSMFFFIHIIALI